MKAGKIGLFFSFITFILQVYALLLLSVSASAQATINGSVTNLISGVAVIGAKIEAGSTFTYSVAGGKYQLVVPAGTYSLKCTKPGFEDFIIPSITVVNGGLYAQNFKISELTNPPGPSFATLDSALVQQVVKITWDKPSGPYEVLYNDGIEDAFSIWAQQGNMHAVKFTPAGYPATITGCMINLGSPADYPNGAPTIPFQVAVYDENSSGMPGNVIGGPYDIIPSGTGWIYFDIPQIAVASGNFFLVMIQGGNPPNAAGIAVDTTFNTQRSFSRFATGGGNWIPGQGNYMMRAELTGPGGPLPPFLGPSSQAGLLGYTVFRLRQGEELNPAVWTTIGYPSSESIKDFSWPSLPCGPYRWGIKANYSGSRVSDVTFSNVLGKCWTKSVTIHTGLSCPETPVTGTKIVMTNMVYPDTVYTAILQNTSDHTFPTVWKGTYQISVTRFGYQESVSNQSIETDTSFTFILLQEKTPPHNLQVDNQSLIARWSPPKPETEIFNETWDSGDFLTNSWTVAGGQNWGISAGFGNPMPSAVFGYSPAVANYSQTLTSKEFTGLNSAVMKLRYDIFLDNFGNTTLNQMAVELWDGSSWHLLKNYSNTGGDIDWTAQDLDISQYSGVNFKIRFRAYGGDSYDINNWNIDNIKVIASESVAIAGSCVIGYNVYLNNMLCNVTTDTISMLPPEFVTYGSSNLCCVNAIYASGPSVSLCTNFISSFLYPPSNLSASTSGSNVILSWNRPQLFNMPGIPPPGLIGYRIFRNGAAADSLMNPDILTYTDAGLFPGYYNYEVDAIYDLTPYGFSGTGYSIKDGPVRAELQYGIELPFSEPWDGGSYQLNGWDPGLNWNIEMSDGNPQPSSAFYNEPVMTGYTSSLESDVFNAMDISCSKIWFDFDVRLFDKNGTGAEKLSCEVFYNNIWHSLTSFTNNGDIQWTSNHLDISTVKGKGFRIRFMASGSSTNDINRWEIDNINIYAVCKPPRDLSADPAGSSVLLTWNEPECDEGYSLNEGFEENIFPPEHWDVITLNQAGTWSHTDNSSPTGVHSGNYAAAVLWDYSHQDEWIVARNVLVTGDLTYWSYCFQGSSHLDHYYVKLSDNHGQSWTILSDLSAMSPYPSGNGYNIWETPYVVDLSSWPGQVVDIAWQAVDGDGQGLWYNWAIDDCQVGGKKLELALNPSGYDVWRKDPGASSFHKINQTPIPGETCTDWPETSGYYAYYVTQFPSECSEIITSDTVYADVVASVPDHEKINIKIYPNPVRDIVTIESFPLPILKVSIYNQKGILLEDIPVDSIDHFTFSTQKIPSGLYFVKIFTKSDSEIRKIVIIK